MMSKPTWRFYIQPSSGDGLSNSVTVVKSFREEGCGLYFLVDDTGISPPFFFGKTIPTYKGRKGYFRTSDIDTAMQAIRTVREEYVRQKMSKLGFSSVDTHKDDEGFCDAVQNEDGSIVVISTHLNFHRNRVETIWAIDPIRVTCRGKYIYEGESEFRSFREGVQTIPREKAEGIIRDALRGYYDARVREMLDADPSIITREWAWRKEIADADESEAAQ